MSAQHVTMFSQETVREIKAHLVQKSLSPTDAWLHTFLSSQRATTPLPALKSTALFRLLASDFTQSLQQTPVSTFPADIASVDVKSRLLPGPLAVQVIDVEDVGSSKWSQLESIESAERGETTQGREIVRVLPGEDDAAPSVASGNGPFKLTLQDTTGTLAYALEVARIDGIGLNMNIGAKLILKDLNVGRGVILLEPRHVSVLGGKIDAMHQSWKDARKRHLQQSLGILDR